MTPTFWGKGTTLLQLCYVLMIVLLTWLDLSLSMVTPLVAAMVGFTLTSGFHYIYRSYRQINASLPPA
jgi:cardiolipin synthase